MRSDRNWKNIKNMFKMYHVPYTFKPITSNMEFQLLGQIVPKINQDPRFVSWSRLVNFGSLGLFCVDFDRELFCGAFALGLFQTDLVNYVQKQTERAINPFWSIEFKNRPSEYSIHLGQLCPKINQANIQTVLVNYVNKINQVSKKINRVGKHITLKRVIEQT